MHGSVDVVKSLVEAGANPGSAESATGRTALHKAAYWGHIGTVNYLISTGKVNVNAVDCNGDLALHDASRFKHTACIEALAAVTADPNLKNKAGQTPTDLRNL